MTHDPPLGISESSSINTSTDAAFASVRPPAIRPPRAVLEIPTIETVSTFPSADLPSKSRCARFASSLFLNLRRTVTFSASLGVLCSDDSRIGPHRLKIAYNPIVVGKIVFRVPSSIQASKGVLSLVINFRESDIAHLNICCSRSLRKIFDLHNVRAHGSPFDGEVDVAS